MNRSELAGLIAQNPPFAPSSPTMSQETDHSPGPDPASPRARFQSSIRNLRQQPGLAISDSSRHRRRRSELELVGSLRVAHRRARSAQPTPRDTPDFYTAERDAWASASPEFPSRSQAVCPTGQHRTQPHARTALRQFEPLHTIVDVDERPKTSRGHQEFEVPNEASKNEGTKPEWEVEVRDDTDEENAHPATSTSQPGRMSKFIEGSMNQRCSGTASSWILDGQIASDKPLPPTPVGKHVTFTCTPICESVEAPVMGPDGGMTRKKERKGLMKSISHFKIQALSGKMKIFAGGSNGDAQLDTTEKRRRQRYDSGVELLNERKRKAEEAYAAQFGLKRQRFSGSIELAAPSPNIAYQHNACASRSASRASELGALPISRLARKQSRRDLELENAELRARLAQQQQAQHHSAATQDSFARGEKAVNMPAVKMRRRRSLGDVPPVPKLPGEGILQALDNGSQRRRPRSSVDGGKRDTSLADLERGQTHIGVRQPQWEWPEDVF